MIISRRDLLRLGLAGGASLVFPRIGRAQTGSPPSIPFSQPMPVPVPMSPVSADATTDYYEITMRAAQKEIFPGLQTQVWGYNGSFPGPTIRARAGRNVVVKQTNNLQVEATVHLHGGHVPASSDGHPMDLIAPGTFKNYLYPNSQLPATLWYHDHTMDFTGRNVFMGLAGFYITTDEFEDSLPLPAVCWRQEVKG